MNNILYFKLNINKFILIKGAKIYKLYIFYILFIKNIKNI